MPINKNVWSVLREKSQLIEIFSQCYQLSADKIFKAITANMFKEPKETI